MSRLDLSNLRPEDLRALGAEALRQGRELARDVAEVAAEHAAKLAVHQPDSVAELRRLGELVKEGFERFRVPE